jgi:hypothetical protein
MSTPTDYQRGFRDGYIFAREAVWRNRNHNHALSGYAPETPEQAYARIYSAWPAPAPAPLAGAENKLPGAPIKATVDLMLDSIDLYVVLPPKGTLMPLEKPGPDTPIPMVADHGD